MTITLLNTDCMAFMATLPDKAFDLAIVDPPYGILNKTKRGSQRSPHLYSVRGEDWDYVPDKEYFDELMRVSNNQIICGGNYFSLPLSNAWIFWHKHQPISNYSVGEMLWTSFEMNTKIFDFPCYGNIGQDVVRFHPTQKPVKLYEWLLTNYAKPGQRILDTHGGSMSIAIACHNLGYDLTLCVARFEQHKAQGSLFEPEPVRTTSVQSSCI
ncbi:MAG: Modification methylase [Candidatus Nomurabacteria bacterium GW2011_GWF1_31_48]|uniref:Modification methylase n=1 Tax=Candidatus Nomurabacteria bacterium GW2011_GWF1_31_48 TaxID=1618767 RepID=A0A0G0BEA2_9BACT|nr:MAG: Modification methylase [Candidatus Nomurabacteria bacterium GW2011_GWF1_31_48]